MDHSIILAVKRQEVNESYFPEKFPFLLSIKEKEIASKIYKLLIKEKNKLIENRKYLKKIKKKMFILGINKIDYIEILDINKIIEPYKKIKRYKIFIAYYLGQTRLIDNF